MKMIVFGKILILLLTGMLVLIFKIHPVIGTIRIVPPDGSIDPPTAPIMRVGNVYTFTADIYDSIDVDVPSIVIDGAGYTLQGNGSGTGIDLTSVSNVTVANVTIKSFTYGIWLGYSSGNTVSGNNITDNYCGIRLSYSSGNTIYHNNFVDNTQQVYDYSWGDPQVSPSINVWDDGYPSGGNYWSDYRGVDCYSGPNQDLLGSDGIGDTPYVMDASNTDRYPLINPGPPIPDFQLMVSPTSLTIRRGESWGSEITVTSMRGFSHPVQLTVLQLPIGVTATLNPDQVTPSPYGYAGSSLTVSVNATATLGTYTFTLVGTNGTLTRNVNITLEITPAPPYRVTINPPNFSLMSGESIILTATITDAFGPIPGVTISWYIRGDPFLSGKLNTNNLTTNEAGQVFATYTASEVPCESLVEVYARLLELKEEIVSFSSSGKVSPNPPLTIPILIVGCLLPLTRVLPNKKFRRALLAILILGFSSTLSYPLGFSSNFSSLILSAKVPSWFLAGLFFIGIVATSFSVLEQSSKYGLILGISCWTGIILGLVFPNPESLAFAGIEAFLTPTVEGLTFSGILAVLARIGSRIERAHLHHIVKTAEKSYSEEKLLQAAKSYAKALSIGLKTNYKQLSALIEQYAFAMKKIIYQAMFRGKEEDKKTLHFAIELQKTFRNNKLPSASHKAKQISNIDLLLEKAQNNDIDFIVNEALNDKTFSKSFLEKTSKSEIMITDLAKELDYSAEATKKLLQKGIEKNMIEGVLTLDGKKLISKSYLRIKLKEKME